MARLKKNFCLFFTVFLLCLSMSGCGMLTNDSDSNNATKIVDANKRIVTLKNIPKNFVVLSPDFLELVQAVDGNVVGCTHLQSGKENAAETVGGVGYISDVDVDKVARLKPDVVLAHKGMHERYLHTLESKGIPVIVLSLKSSEDIARSRIILEKIMHK